jgi:hypothetical protein
MIQPPVLFVRRLQAEVQNHGRKAYDYGLEIDALRKQCEVFVKKPTSKRLRRLFQDAETVRRFHDGLCYTHKLEVTENMLNSSWE